MNILFLILMLVVGYMIKIIGIMTSDAHPNIPCTIPGLLVYFKEKQLETLGDVLIVFSVAVLWVTTGTIVLGKSIGFAPFISYGATKIWQQFAQKITKESIK